MIQETFTIKNQTGLHLTPATMIAQKALEYEHTEVLMKKDDYEVDAKSVTNILSLGAAAGARIIVTVNGPDEAKLFDELKAIFEDEGV